MIANLQLAFGTHTLTDNQESHAYTQFTWPQSDVTLSINSLEGQHLERTENGPWALFKLLEKLGRKKIVLDRGPSHPDYKNAKPWMNRYYLLFRNRPKWFPFNILIHEMLDNDHGEGVHTHLCPYITIVLRGGYWETLKTGKHWRPPGYVGFRSANNLHRVDLKPHTRPLTLFIPGPFGLRKGPRSEYGIDFKIKK